MKNSKTRTEKTARTQPEKLVDAICSRNNVYAQDMLAKILSKKVEDRYDYVMMKNG